MQNSNFCLATLESMFHQLRGDDSIHIGNNDLPQRTRVEWHEATLRWKELSPMEREQFVKECHDTWVISWDSRPDNFDEVNRLLTRLLPGIDVSREVKLVYDVKSRSRLWNYTGD